LQAYQGVQAPAEWGALRLEGRALACVRGGRTVFSGLEFTIGSGQALLVIGRNGAGKSSLLRMVAGLVRIAGGQLVLAGAAGDTTIPEQAHYLGHQDALKPSLTVAENLGFWIRYLGGDQPLQAALATVGLAALADLPAAYLSAGQRRRLSLARLLGVRRPVWLLDEPVSALDRDGQNVLAGLMRQHLSAGGIIMAATHGPIGLDDAAELRLGDTP
jgi:heme exporter protein A